MVKGIYCQAGMVIGLFIDQLRSPTGSIPSLCAAGVSFESQAIMHVQLLPMAHLGMLFGAVICVLVLRIDRPLHFGLLLARQLGCMALAEFGAILLTSPLSNPVLMMTVMGGLTLLLAQLPLQMKNSLQSANPHQRIKSR